MRVHELSSAASESIPCSSSSSEVRAASSSEKWCDGDRFEVSCHRGPRSSDALDLLVSRRAGFLPRVRAEPRCDTNGIGPAIVRAPEPRLERSTHDLIEIVIVGGGLAAARIVRAYREAGGDAPMTMLSAETQLPYNRPPLSKGFLRGEVEAEAVFVEPACRLRGARSRRPSRRRRDRGRHAARRRRARRRDGASATTGSSSPAGRVPRRLGIPGEQLDGRARLPHARRRR